MTYRPYEHDALCISNSKKRKHSDDVKRENKRIKNRDADHKNSNNNNNNDNHSHSHSHITGHGHGTPPEYVLPPRHRKRYKKQKKFNVNRTTNYASEPHHTNPLYMTPYDPPPRHHSQPYYSNGLYPPYPPPHMHHPNHHVNNMSQEPMLQSPNHEFEMSSSSSNPSTSTHSPEIQLNPLNPTDIQIAIVSEKESSRQCIDSQQFEYDLSCRNSTNASMYDIYYGEYFVSIDVECGATGFGHFDSAPVRISMVDFFGTILFDRICFIPNLIDPLTEFTGLNMSQIEQYGDSLTNVLSEFHDILAGYNKLYKFGLVLVGQSVIMDIIWTKLQHGVHYSRIIDIAHQFRTKKEKWSKYTYYSLRQVAWALLECHMNDQYHDPTEDARVTMQLYREFCLNEEILNGARDKLQYCKNRNEFPDFKVYTKFPQCCAMYSPNKCFCGQQSAAHLSSYDDIEKLRKLYYQHAKSPVRHL